MRTNARVAAIALPASLLVSSCAPSMQYSYVEREIIDPDGVFASSIADVALRNGGSAHIVEPYSDNELTPQIVSRIEESGVDVREDAEPLRYYISKLYDGLLLRVNYVGQWTAQFFKIADGSIAKAGPNTILRRS